MRTLLFFAFCVSAFSQTAASVSPYINYQFMETSTGVALPCVGCKLYSYTAGTLTPFATFTDYTGTVANSNPITLDSGGYTPSGIWIKTQCYKFILKTSALVTIWTRDQVCDNAQLNKAALAASNGATLIGFEAANSTTATTVYAALNLYGLYPQYFGATGNGSTDDTTALQSALDAVAGAGQNTLYVSPGNYLIGALTIPTRVKIQCKSSVYGSTVVNAVFKANAGSITLFSSADSGVYNAFNGCYFNGNSQTSLVGIFFDTTNSASVTNCVFQNFGSGSIDIKGGGTLYTEIAFNSMDASNAGRALDFLNSYSSHSGSTYYGINAGSIHDNNINAHLGIRAEGDIDFVHNDLEVVLNTGAAAIADFTCSVVECFVKVRDNYWESTLGTAAALVAMRFDASNRADIVAENNHIILDGSAGSIGISATGITTGLVRIEGNEFRNMITGVTLSLQSATYSPGAIISSNLWRDVSTTYISNDLTRNQGQGQNTNSAHTSPQTGNQCLMQDPVYGNIMCGALVPTIQHIGGDATLSTIDISRGNIFILDSSALRTISGVTGNVTKGNWFILYGYGNDILSNSVFHLAANRDTTLPNITFGTGHPLTFIIDDGGAIREVGTASRDIPITYAVLGTCNSANEGNRAPITDSNTSTFGATISGSGANHGLAFCDGTNWTFR